jgi:predicted transcriptional regulator
MVWVAKTLSDSVWEGCGMSQRDIIDFLGSDPDNWFSVSELTKIFKVGNSTLNDSLSKLKKRGEVSFMKYYPNNGGVGYLYKHKLQVVLKA